MFLKILTQPPKITQNIRVAPDTDLAGYPAGYPAK